MGTTSSVGLRSSAGCRYSAVISLYSAYTGTVEGSLLYWFYVRRRLAFLAVPMPIMVLLCLFSRVGGQSRGQIGQSSVQRESGVKPRSRRSLFAFFFLVPCRTRNMHEPFPLLRATRVVFKVLDEGDGSYPSEEEEEEEEERVPTDITAEGVELIASYWYSRSIAISFDGLCFLLVFSMKVTFLGFYFSWFSFFCLFVLLTMSFFVFFLCVCFLLGFFASGKPNPTHRFVYRGFVSWVHSTPYSVGRYEDKEYALVKRTSTLSLNVFFWGSNPFIHSFVSSGTPILSCIVYRS